MYRYLYDDIGIAISSFYVKCVSFKISKVHIEREFVLSGSVLLSFILIRSRIELSENKY